MNRSASTGSSSAVRRLSGESQGVDPGRSWGPWICREFESTDKSVCARRRSRRKRRSDSQSDRSQKCGLQRLSKNRSDWRVRPTFRFRTFARVIRWLPCSKRGSSANNERHEDSCERKHVVFIVVIRRVRCFDRVRNPADVTRCRSRCRGRS